MWARAVGSSRARIPEAVGIDRSKGVGMPRSSWWMRHLGESRAHLGSDHVGDAVGASSRLPAEVGEGIRFV